MPDRADHEVAVPSIRPCKEGDLIYLRSLGRIATVTDIADREIGAVLSNGQTVLVRIVERNAAVRA